MDVSVLVESRPSSVQTAKSQGFSTATEPTQFTQSSQNPYNWSKRKKISIVILLLNSVLNSTISSAMPSGNPAIISTALHINTDSQLVSLTSIYLLGYIFGPLGFGPLSEIYGRRAILIPTFFSFCIFTLASALSPIYSALIIFRFLTGLAASAPITIVGGVYADIYDDPISRGRTMAAFLAGNTFGPILGPLISGFSSELGWRWPFWIALIYGGFSWILLWLLPETYAPVLKKKFENKQLGTYHTKTSLPKEPKPGPTPRDILLRPLQLFFLQPIVFCICVYLAFAFGIQFLFFEAYPIIFHAGGVYGMMPGVSALAFLPIGIGAIFACGIFFWYDNILLRAQVNNKDWAKSEEGRRLPLACLAGPIFAISLFWLAWTSSRNIPWIIPMLAGLPFGIGFLLIFMTLTNYLTDLYKEQAASVMAAATCTRSIFGAALPFAAQKMYAALGVHWATSLLGFLALLLSTVPFCFWLYGARLRTRGNSGEDTGIKRGIDKSQDLES